MWQAFRDYLESPTSAADASLARLTDRLRNIKVAPLASQPDGLIWP